LTGNYSKEAFMEIKEIKAGLKPAKDRTSKIMVYL
jgi:hypothetical protein